MKKYKVRHWVVFENGFETEVVSRVEAPYPIDASLKAQEEIYQLWDKVIECDEISMEEDQIEGKF